MVKLFFKRGHNGRTSLTTIPTTRMKRWRAAFDDGRGPLFYATALVAAFVGLYLFLLLVLSL